MQRATSIFALVALLAASPLAAAEGAAPAATIESGAAEHLIRVVLALGAILALIFAATWVVRRMGYLQFGGNEDFRVVASLAVGQRERLIVVKVGEEQIVVGVAPGRISRIHRLDRPLPEPAREKGPVVPFAERLGQALGRGEGDKK